MVVSVLHFFCNKHQIIFRDSMAFSNSFAPIFNMDSARHCLFCIFFSSGFKLSVLYNCTYCSFALSISFVHFHFISLYVSTSSLQQQSCNTNNNNILSVDTTITFIS